MSGDEREGDAVDAVDGPENEDESGVESSAAATAELTPTAAFEALGHDIRLRIVESLAERRRDHWGWFGKRFAELRRDVEVRDAGKFSYHLEELQPQFVVKDGEEYKLTFAGMQVAGAVVAGTYDDRAEVASERLDVDCQLCGEPLIARYDNEYCRLACENHGEFYGNTLPPGAAETRTASELVKLADREAVRDVQRARDGACPHCWGPMVATLPAESVMPNPETGERPDSWESLLGGLVDEVVVAQFTCDRCGLTFSAPPGFCIAEHPEVSGFCYEHGVNVRETPLAALEFTYLTAGTLESTEPIRVRVDVEFDDDCLQVWLDEETNVVETARA